VGLIAIAALVLVAVFLAIALVRYNNMADYPGATNIAGGDTIKYWPHFSVRRITSYRTSDPMPRVYNWYSNGFSLGPELYAIGDCIQIAKSFTDYNVVEREISVTLCDTSSGRMIYVTRSLTLLVPS